MMSWTLLPRSLACRAVRRAAWLFLVGLLTTMASGLYPNALPAREGQPYSLTIDKAVTGERALHVLS